MDSIIFDVDGTLWDSTPICAEAYNITTIAAEGYNPHVTAEQLQGLFGQLLSDIAKVVFPESSPQRQQELIELCVEEEHRLLLQCEPPIYPGIEETLRELSKKYRLFIVSNCEAGYIELFLQVTGFGPYIEGHLCPGDTGNAKAENIQQIIKDYHLTSPVYVGDTDGDHTATKTAGIPFVFASYGFGKVSNPDYTITCLKDLLNIF